MITVQVSGASMYDDNFRETSAVAMLVMVATQIHAKYVVNGNEIMKRSECVLRLA